MTEQEKAMVEAVRADPKIGRGTCAMVDECMDDSDILEELEREGATTPEEAIEVMKRAENDWRDVANEARGAGGLSLLPDV